MTRLVRFSNNAVSKLASAITSTSTTITLQTGDGAKFPALTGTQFFKATLVKADGTTEVVKVTARSTDTLTVVRAAEAVAGVQVAYAFSAGDRIEHRLTAGDVASELDRLDAAAYISPLNKSANYTVTAADITSLIRVNTGSGNVTITLPEISTLTEDFDVIVAKVTADTNVVTVQRAGTTDTINGATTYSLTGQWQGAWLTADRSTGTWNVIASGGAGVKANVDTFTGSGTAGPFTLSGDPGVKENTAVYVGGVYQQKSTYTLVGTSLMLGGTVATGVPIEVIWAQPLQVGITSANQTTASDGASGSLFTTVQGFISWVMNAFAKLSTLAASSGASLIGFIQSGTGAVARTVQDELRDRVSVKQFGAVGDGVADDTAAFQAAINEAGNAHRPLYIPPGRYKITSTLTIYGSGKNIQIYGAGYGAGYQSLTRIVYTGTGACIYIPSTNNYTTLRDFSITNDPALNSAYGILIEGYHHIFERITIEDFQQGSAFATGTATIPYQLAFHECYASGNKVGFDFPKGQNLILQHCFMESNQTNCKIGAVETVYNFAMENGYNFLAGKGYYGNVVETDTSIGIDVISCQNFVYRDVFGEVNGGGVDSSSTQQALHLRDVKMAVISGGYLYGGARVTTPIVFEANVKGAIVEGMCFNTFPDGSYMVTAASSAMFEIGQNRTSSGLFSVFNNSWTPTPTNLTVVNGTGGVTYVGTWNRSGNTINFTIEFRVTGSATTASTANSTYVAIGSSALPAVKNYGACYAVSGGTITSLGNGFIDKSSSRVYLPGWTARNETIVISGTYECDNPH